MKVKKVRITIMVEKKLFDEIEKARGYINRSLYVEHLLKNQLDRKR